MNKGNIILYSAIIITVVASLVFMTFYQEPKEETPASYDSAEGSTSEIIVNTTAVTVNGLEVGKQISIPIAIYNEQEQERWFSISQIPITTFTAGYSLIKNEDGYTVEHNVILMPVRYKKTGVFDVLVSLNSDTKENKEVWIRIKEENSDNQVIVKVLINGG